MSKLIFLAAILAISCGKDADPPQPEPDMAADMAVDMPIPDMPAPDMPDMAADMPVEATGCDDLDPGHCALPWPSNYFLKPDATRPTGYTLEFGAESLPRNRDGVFIEPTPYKRMDGYGLGSPAVALFPNVDASNFPDEYNIEGSMAADAQIILLELSETVRRVPYFVDHDAQTTRADRKSVIVRPAEILKPGTRYAVAFRNLKTLDGADIAPSSAFQALASGSASGHLAERQTRFNELFAILDAQGWERSTLTLAWDWNTASSDGLHRYMLHMRDEAFQMFPEGPELTITNITEFTEAENELVALRMEGEFQAPHYIEVVEGDAYLRLGADGLPEAQGTRTVPFWVQIPRTALTGDPHGLIMYGHGLFGTGSQTYGGFNSRIADKHKFIFFGASLWGMANQQGTEDAVQISLNLSKFRIIGDQLHQGMLEWLLLARAFKHHFGDLEEVSTRQIELNEELYYSGISQGGIFGPTFVALSPDVQYGHSGVPGHTYGTLLHRSVDFTPFFIFLKSAYPDPVDQLLGLNTVQLLWDGTDPVSYVWKLSADPFDGQQNHVLFVPTKGDFQVSVMQNETLARTPGLGVALMEHYDVERDVALVNEATYPHTGSAVVLYDFEIEANGVGWRNPWPTAGNRVPVGGGHAACPAECPAGERVGGAPFECCDGMCCFDAHGLPRNAEWHNDQMIHFFRNSAEVIDVCNGDGCTPD